MEIQELDDVDDDIKAEDESFNRSFFNSQKQLKHEDGSFLNYIKFAIEIEDSGVGISQQNLKNIFVDFGKLDEHSKINKIGTGLGLSICKLIVENMRGQIQVESTLNVGTTFKVLIGTKIVLKKEPRFVRKF